MCNDDGTSSIFCLALFLSACDLKKNLVVTPPVQFINVLKYALHLRENA